MNNCHYWAKDNYCNAEQIMVSSDRTGDTTPHTFNALQAADFPHTPVKSCMDTCCKTFVTREGDARADGIKKME
ncbi:MAG: DUF1540 domain-containing protein [Firmicutes bacterium]|nr:DUF1540 domain-containing protein [Bacillota bacterium]